MEDLGSVAIALNLTKLSQVLFLYNVCKLISPNTLPYNIEADKSVYIFTIFCTHNFMTDEGQSKEDANGIQIIDHYLSVLVSVTVIYLF